MYAPQFSDELVKHPFDFTALLKQYSDQYISIFSIDAYKDVENDYIYDEEIAAVELKKIAEKNIQTPFLIIFSIPSPLGSRNKFGHTISHAISALIDFKNERITVQEPLFGVIDPRTAKPIEFHSSLKQLLHQFFPEFPIIENKENVQKPGENICHLVSILRAKNFSESSLLSNAFISRERLLQEWSGVMNQLNTDDATRKRRLDFIGSALFHKIARALIETFHMVDKDNKPADNLISLLSSHSTQGYHIFYFTLFKPFDEQNMTKFLTQCFDYVDADKDGQLTEFGQSFIKFFIARTLQCSPDYFMRKENGKWVINPQLIKERIPIDSWVKDIQQHIKDLISLKQSDKPINDSRTLLK